MLTQDYWVLSKPNLTNSSLLIKHYFHNEIEIRATSRSNPDSILMNQASILTMKLTVITDRLFIQFAEPNYYINTPKALDTRDDTMRIYQFANLKLKNTSFDEFPLENEFINREQTQSLFFSRAHLIQRKLKRNIRFNIQMVQMTKSGEENLHYLPLDVVNTLNGNQSEHSVSDFIEDTNLDQERVSLFDIDAITGKV